MVMHKTRKMAYKAFVSTSVSILSLVLIYQILFMINMCFPIDRIYIRIGEPVLLGTIFCFSSYLVKYFSKPVSSGRYIAEVGLNLSLFITLLAFIFKLDSHPLSLPYSEPSLLLIPSLFSGIVCALLLNH